MTNCFFLQTIHWVLYKGTEHDAKNKTLNDFFNDLEIMTWSKRSLFKHYLSPNSCPHRHITGGNSQWRNAWKLMFSLPYILLVMLRYGINHQYYLACATLAVINYRDNLYFIFILINRNGRKYLDLTCSWFLYSSLYERWAERAWATVVTGDQ